MSNLSKSESWHIPILFCHQPHGVAILEARKARKGEIVSNSQVTALPANKLPTVGCLPLNPSELRKLRPSWHISSEPGTYTYTLARVVKEVKLQTKLVEKSSGKVDPNQFLHPEMMKEVMNSFSK